MIIQANIFIPDESIYTMFEECEKWTNGACSVIDVVQDSINFILKDKFKNEKINCKIIMPSERKTNDNH